ncbi:hypothetical protein HDU98_000568 [Podochytrium sp. JEL0797]|nr:hypothetical protein HDU98_000568 [Podochytrium sp. JEL0797]
MTSPETFRGIVADELDSYLLIEACISNHLNALNVNPTSITSLNIQSGTCIVNQGAFLLYKEFDKDKKIAPNGLSKRTITLTGSTGQRYRVISYFSPQDVNPLSISRSQMRQQGPDCKLQRPSDLLEFKKFLPRIPQSPHVASLISRAFQEDPIISQYNPQPRHMRSPPSIQSRIPTPSLSFHYSPEPHTPPMRSPDFSRYEHTSSCSSPHQNSCMCGGLNGVRLYEMMHMQVKSGCWERPAILAPLRADVVMMDL